MKHVAASACVVTRSDNVVLLPLRRPSPPPFDPNNPTHQAAWENLWLAGQALSRRDREGC